MARGDEVAAQMYVGHTLEESLRLCHLINKKYAPYRKWLYWSFVRLPKLAPDMLPLVDQAALAPQLGERRDAMLEIAKLVQKALKTEGIVPSGHEGDLLSYAGAIHRKLGGRWKQCFNRHIHDAWGSCDCIACELV